MGKNVTLRKVTVPPKAVNPKGLLHSPSSEITPWRGQRERLHTSEEWPLVTSMTSFWGEIWINIQRQAGSLNQTGYEKARFPLENYPISPLETCQYKGQLSVNDGKNEFLTGLLLDIQLFHWLASDQSDVIREFQQRDTVEGVRRRCRGEAEVSGVGQLNVEWTEKPVFP